ncbi:MAG: hypothetical protein IPL46_30495 [Saprospiraceae bacterium]|nr:hypothetical protein [Saprospiraceae bacterium]
MAKAKNNRPEKRLLGREELDALKDDFRHSGYLLPTNDEEFEGFEQIYGSTQVIFPEHLKNPRFNKQEQEQLPRQEPPKESLEAKVVDNRTYSSSKNGYFRKIVLAAKIAHELYMEPTFGRVKFVKILFICEKIVQLELETKYRKYAAGPLDPKYIYSIEGEFKKQQWFQVVKRDRIGVRYEPSDKISNYKKYFDRYYANQSKQILQIIELFRKEKSDFCEIVATLYAVWKELLENKALVNNATLSNAFFAWSKEKKKCTPDKVGEAIKWMRSNDITPSQSSSF